MFLPAIRTDSLYVPGLTLTVSPAFDLFTADWIVVNLQSFFCLQTVRVLPLPFGFGATLPGLDGSG